jgi:hypothetical protein
LQQGISLNELPCHDLSDSEGSKRRVLLLAQ